MRYCRWRDEQDRDGGVTSDLGFRVVIDPDEETRVINTSNGERYLRPDEADSARRAAEAARTAAEQRVRELEEELARLRGKATGKA